MFSLETSVKWDDSRNHEKCFSEQVGKEITGKGRTEGRIVYVYVVNCSPVECESYERVGHRVYSPGDAM